MCNTIHKVVLALFALALTCQAYSQVVLTNMTPEIPVPSSWAYETTPGGFFWLGFGLFLGLGLLALGARWVKMGLGGTGGAE